MLITGSELSKTAKSFLCGAVIGMSMLIPGVSGGTTAVILGIYDSLTEAAGNLPAVPKKSLSYLIPVASGGLLGAAILSRPILALTERYYVFSVFFFIGAIMGTVPMLVKKSGIKVNTLYNSIFALFGTAAAVGIRFIPGAGMGGEGIVINILCGFIIAVGMVLPGISTSHLLLMLGMYESVWGCLKDPDILFLLPLAVGGAAGTILTARITDMSLKKFPCQTYMVITGFVMSSVYDLFPESIDISAVPVYIFLCASGFLSVYFITRFAEKRCPPRALPCERTQGGKTV